MFYARVCEFVCIELYTQISLKRSQQRNEFTIVIGIQIVVTNTLKLLGASQLTNSMHEAH